MRRRQSRGAERQEDYRRRHPQMNVTFRDLDEHHRVRQALQQQRITVREVLLAWAATVEGNEGPHSGPR
jgi:hypothetical protein